MEDYRDDIIPHTYSITKKDRAKKNGFISKVLWFTGLSGSGKSTLANALEVYFYNRGLNTYILDGDNIRVGLNNDLDFSDQGRKENIRRISSVAKLFVDANVIVLTAFISPFKKDRELACDIVGREDFIEIYVDCPLDVCEQRDMKELYMKARAGQIKHFTGIDSPYEPPDTPDVRVDTANNSLENCLKKLVREIEPKIVI